MKKILFIASIGSDINGADKSMTYQMIRCSQLGFKVVVVASYLTEEYKCLLDEHSITYYQIAYTWWQSIEHSDENSNVLNFQAVSALIKIIQEEKVDTTITNTANIPHLALAAAVTGKPHIWLVHEFPMGDFAYTSEKYDFISRFSNAIIASGTVLADILKNEYNLDHVSYFLPYTDKPDISHDYNLATRLVSVNAITGDGKNHLETIKIFEKLQVEFPNLELLITGSIINQKYYEELLTYIKDNSIKNVKFIKNKTFEDNWASVNIKDIFINSSKMETFGLTTVEAVLSGVRTVVTDTAGKALCKLGFLPKTILYRLGDVDAAVAIVRKQLMSSTNTSNKEMSMYTLENTTQPLVDAINYFDSNPEASLKHFNEQIKDVANVLEERLILLNQQKALSDERMNVINRQEQELSLLKKINEERMVVINQQQDVIEDKEQTISSIKKRLGYRVLRKLGLVE